MKRWQKWTIAGIALAALIVILIQLFNISAGFEVGTYDHDGDRTTTHIIKIP